MVSPSTGEDLDSTSWDETRRTVLEATVEEGEGSEPEVTSLHHGPPAPSSVFSSTRHGAPSTAPSVFLCTPFTPLLQANNEVVSAASPQAESTVLEEEDTSLPINTEQDDSAEADRSAHRKNSMTTFVPAPAPAPAPAHLLPSPAGTTWHLQANPRGE